MELKILYADMSTPLDYFSSVCTFMITIQIKSTDFILAREVKMIMYVQYSVEVRFDCRLMFVAGAQYYKCPNCPFVAEREFIW